MTPLSQRLETGHAHIDAQHCEFLRHLGVMKQAIDNGAGRERIAELITLLQQYALVHFADEENYMRAVNCPALAENHAAHQDFARRLDGWLILLSSIGSSVTLLSDIQRESTAWMLSHIAGVDCKLRGCRHTTDPIHPAAPDALTAGNHGTA